MDGPAPSTQNNGRQWQKPKPKFFWQYWKQTRF